MMEFWLDASDILENLDLEENSVVSQVIQVVGMIGDALSLEATVDQVDPVTALSGQGNPVNSVTEHTGEDNAIIRCDKDCSDDGQEGRTEDTPKKSINENQPAGNEEEEDAEDDEKRMNDVRQDSHEHGNHISQSQISELNVIYSLASSLSPLSQHNSQSVKMIIDNKVTQGEISDPVREPRSWAAGATSASIEQEREEAGTVARNHSREVFVTSLGNDQGENDQNETVLSGESSTAPNADPRPEQTQTHALTSVRETQTELSSFPPEARTLKEPPETPPIPSGLEAQSPVTPSEVETPAEPPELEASPCLETPASETGFVETPLQLGQPAEAETLLPQARIAELERTCLETPSPGLASPPEQDTQPMPASESEPETQTESEINFEQEQACAPLEEEVTSMDETVQVTEELTGQSSMEAEPGYKEEEPSQNTPSKEAEKEIEVEVEEEEGAHGGTPEKAPHSSQNDPSRPYGETIRGDEKNHPNLSKYKTVSYRKIRKGNTKQRIDEFESIINT